jgi:hypothetical protein
MSADEKLTENVRVRLTASEKAELEAAAAVDDRSAASLIRRAIRAEVARIKHGTRRKS